MREPEPETGVGLTGPLNGGRPNYLTYSSECLMERKVDMSRSLTSKEEFLTALTSSSEGIIRIKPRVIFELAEANLPASTRMNLAIPSSLLGSVTMLEASIMVSLLKLFEPKLILEFGTFLGFSTSLFLENSEEAKVISIDLPGDIIVPKAVQKYSDEQLHSNDRMNDDYLRWIQSARGHPFLEGLAERERQRLTLLKADSRTIPVSSLQFCGCPDFTFIDGGHDRVTVESDTSKTMAAMGGSGIVVWHDFESSIHSDVTRFLLEWPEAPQLVVVESTLLAISFVGRSRSQIEQFASR